MAYIFIILGYWKNIKFKYFIINNLDPIINVKVAQIQRKKASKIFIYIKTKKFKTRQEVATSIGVHIKTLERWVENYKLFLIDQMISDKPKNKHSKIITSEIHLGL